MDEYAAIRKVAQATLVDLIDHFSELNDDPDAALGVYARVEKVDDERLRVLHETEPWGFEVIVRPCVEGDGG